MERFGFVVWDEGLGVGSQGLELRVDGLGVAVWGVGFNAEGLGVGVRAARLRSRGGESETSGGFKIQGLGLRVQV